MSLPKGIQSQLEDLADLLGEEIAQAVFDANVQEINEADEYSRDEWRKQLTRWAEGRSIWADHWPDDGNSECDKRLKALLGKEWPSDAGYAEFMRWVKVSFMGELRSLAAAATAPETVVE